MPQRRFITLIPCSIEQIDLSSDDAKTPNFAFTSAAEHDFEIVAFRTAKPSWVCWAIKNWLLKERREEVGKDRNALRMERQNLHDIDDAVGGTLLFAESAATLDGNANMPISIFGLLLTGKAAIRWFWSLFSVTRLLEGLVMHSLVDIAGSKQFHPGSKMHGRLFAFISESFQAAIRIPDDPDFTAVEAMVPYWKDIVDPNTALHRITKSREVSASQEPLDLSDDRYRDHLHPAELYLATHTQLSCAKYLLYKAIFFKHYWNALSKEKEAIKAGRQVCKPTPLVKFCEISFGMTERKGRKFVKAFELLGLLDESFYLQWATDGAMLENTRMDKKEREVIEE